MIDLLRQLKRKFLLALVTFVKRIAIYRLFKQGLVLEGITFLSCMDLVLFSDTASPLAQMLQVLLDQILSVCVITFFNDRGLTLLGLQFHRVAEVG